MYQAFFTIHLRTGRRRQRIPRRTSDLSPCAVSGYGWGGGRRGVSIRPERCMSTWHLTEVKRNGKCQRRTGGCVHSSTVPDPPFVADVPARPDYPGCLELTPLGPKTSVRIHRPNEDPRDYTDVYELHWRCPSFAMGLPYDVQYAQLELAAELAQKSFFEAFHEHWPKEAHSRGVRSYKQIVFETREVIDVDGLFRRLDKYYINGTERSYESKLFEILKEIVVLRHTVHHPKRPISFMKLWQILRTAENLLTELDDQERLPQIRAIKEQFIRMAHNMHDKLRDVVDSSPRDTPLWHWMALPTNQRNALLRITIQHLAPTLFEDMEQEPASKLSKANTLVANMDSRLLALGPPKSTYGIQREVNLVFKSCPNDPIELRKLWKFTDRLGLFTKVLRTLLADDIFDGVGDRPNTAHLCLVVQRINDSLQPEEMPFDALWIDWRYKSDEEKNQALLGGGTTPEATEAVSILRVLHEHKFVRFEGDATAGFVSCVTDFDYCLDMTQQRLLELPLHTQDTLHRLANSDLVENTALSDITVQAITIWRRAYIKPDETNEYINRIIHSRAEQHRQHELAAASIAAEEARANLILAQEAEDREAGRDGNDNTIFAPRTAEDTAAAQALFSQSKYLEKPLVADDCALAGLLQVIYNSRCGQRTPLLPQRYLLSYRRST